MAAKPDLPALERHASHRQDVPAEQPAPGTEGSTEGSYAPLADKLHRSAPVAAPMPAYRTDQVMKTVRSRRETTFERAVEGSVRRGTLSRDAADALLENRFPAWLDQHFAAKTASAGNGVTQTARTMPTKQL